MDWKAVMERPSGAELRSSPKANQMICETGCVNARENLTRRRGGAEDVRKVLKKGEPGCVSPYVST